MTEQLCFSLCKQSNIWGIEHFSFPRQNRLELFHVQIKHSISTTLSSKYMLGSLSFLLCSDTFLLFLCLFLPFSLCPILCALSLPLSFLIFLSHSHSFSFLPVFLTSFLSFLTSFLLFPFFSSFDLSYTSNPLLLSTDLEKEAWLTSYPHLPYFLFCSIFFLFYFTLEKCFCMSFL